MEEFPTIILNFQQKTPLTEQIRKEIYRLIEQHQLQPGTLLPTVRQLAAKLGVNFNTVARAYRALDAAGLITARQGRGTYVVDSAISRQPEIRPKKIAVQERVALFLKDAERDGITTQEIAQVIKAMTKREHKREKNSLRYGIIGKRKARASKQAKSSAPQPRLKNARSSQRRLRKPPMFHVKQTHSEEKEEHI